MISKKDYPLTRALLQGFIAVIMLMSLAVNVSPALAATPPGNDNFIKAIKISATTFGASISDVTAATSEVSDPFITCDGGGQGEVSVWYTFTALTAGELSVNTMNSGYDTIIGVFKAAYDPSIPGFDPFSLIEIGCNDDASFATKTSAMTIAMRSGIKYYIEIVRKTGTTVTPPDNMRFSFSWVAKPVAIPYLWDGTASVITYSPIGWVLFPVLPGVVKNGNVNVANNPGDAATVFFDGSAVQVCYVMGPDMGNMNVYIDGIFVGTIGQGNGTYQYVCWDSPALPIAGSVSLYEDNVHKLVLQHAGPAGKKVNIDTVEVFPHIDLWPPDPISDLVATTGTATGKVTLTWTATGDDGMYGVVTKNEIRYSLNPIVDQLSWDTATPYVIGLPSLLIAGSKQTVTINGLVPNVLYYFNVRGVDEAGNMGDVSNNASAIAKAPTPVGPGIYDDKSTSWTYTGMWKAVSSPDNINNSLHVANQLGSTATFYFTGTQFRLYYNVGFDQGLMDVTLDGVYLTTIDEYSFVAQRRIYVSPILTNGPHAVQLVQKSLPYINIDAIGIYAVIDGGPPDPILDLTATSGATDGSVDLSWTAMGDDPGCVGKALMYEVRYSLSPIVSDTDWYAASTAPGSIPAPQDATGCVTIENMTVIGLAPGVDYWFAVRASDDAGYTNLSNTATATAAVVTLVYSGSGFYEDTDPNWLYNGIWTTTFPIQASGGDIHAASLSGSTATFLFNGNGFTLTYEKKKGFGGLKVYVDGILVGSIGQSSTITKWQQTWTYSGLVLANHTLQFVTGGKCTIDALEILP
jgi:hypothetical protein